MSDAGPVIIRPLAETDLTAADRIFRVAFGTFLGAPDPERFSGDADYVRTRWLADPLAALAAEIDGRLVGSNFVTNWGAIGFFGPLTVDPACWDRGVAQHLLEATMDLFGAWGTRHAGLFTFAASAKHVGLYQKFGFWPRFLTAVMSRTVEPTEVLAGCMRISEISEPDRAGTMSSIRELTNAIYAGLDISREIEAVLAQGLGDTVLLDDAAGLQGVAVCQVGAGTEAGSGNCYVKFGGVRPGLSAARNFSRLVDACQQLAADRGASVLTVGANAGRDKAWSALTGRGFRAAMQGVAMHRPNEAGYNVTDAYIIDDWR